jgi:hypothetical protein
MKLSDSQKNVNSDYSFVILILPILLQWSLPGLLYSVPIANVFKQMTVLADGALLWYIDMTF